MARATRKTKEGYLYSPLKWARINLSALNKKHGAEKILPNGALVQIKGEVSPTAPGLVNIILVEPRKFHPTTCMAKAEAHMVCNGDFNAKGVCKRCRAPKAKNFYTETTVSVGILTPITL